MKSIFATPFEYTLGKTHTHILQNRLMITSYEKNI